MQKKRSVKEFSGRLLKRRVWYHCEENEKLFFILFGTNRRVEGRNPYLAIIIYLFTQSIRRGSVFCFIFLLSFPLCCCYTFFLLLLLSLWCTAQHNWEGMVMNTMKIRRTFSCFQTQQLLPGDQLPRSPSTLSPTKKSCYFLPLLLYNDYDCHLLQQQ